MQQWIWQFAIIVVQPTVPGQFLFHNGTPVSWGKTLAKVIRDTYNSISAPVKWAIDMTRQDNMWRNFNGPLIFDWSAGSNQPVQMNACTWRWVNKNSGMSCLIMPVIDNGLQGLIIIWSLNMWHQRCKSVTFFLVIILHCIILKSPKRKPLSWVKRRCQTWQTKCKKISNIMLTRHLVMLSPIIQHLVKCCGPQSQSQRLWCKPCQFIKQPRTEPIISGASTN